MNSILGFDALIRYFGPEAIRRLSAEVDWDKKAFEVVGNTGSERRPENLRDWLSSYAVFQGIDNSRRDALTRAVLNWTDNRPHNSRLDTLHTLVGAHADLMAACSQADGRSRDFTSLASKALWLRYPDVVPMYDRFVQEALWMLSKLEPDLPAVIDAPHSASKYGPFALVWRTLYDRYAPSIAAIDSSGYPYRVRIFDRILWLIGEPVYGLSKA